MPTSNLNVPANQTYTVPGPTASYDTVTLNSGSALKLDSTITLTIKTLANTQ